MTITCGAESKRKSYTNHLGDQVNWKKAEIRKMFTGENKELTVYNP
jgi:hypothetical protein